jgi:hypothetical protein
MVLVIPLEDAALGDPVFEDVETDLMWRCTLARARQ